jgi:hypothetical protein
MVDQHRAATCDYAENKRREIAINFVIDAFNGRADAIMSRAKHDNFGTLEQEMKDAYHIVNLHGQAFRNARILPEFLDARLNSLKWAVAVQQLRLAEREEQRQIKEQLREESKARREYERAIREAARDQDTLQRALEAARLEVQQASAEQKAAYERKIEDLGARLREAEERNQRALSMAQQTRRGHVYVISNIGSFGEHVYKIGLTRRLEPLDRIRELGDSSVPFSFDVHALIFSEDAPALETTLHKKFLEAQVNKVNPRKEFFRLDIAAIKQLVESMGLEARWTMAASAMEYRESLAIERKLKGDVKAHDEWVRRQEHYEPIALEDESDDN